MSEVMFKRGDPVEVMIGGAWRAGRVAYARMLGPEYRRVAAYSVVLHDLELKPGYMGTNMVSVCCSGVMVSVEFVRAVTIDGGLK